MDCIEKRKLGLVAILQLRQDLSTEARGPIPEEGN